MLHELLRIWFHWVADWGYWGVFVLMAMESSIIPVPSEVVMPPAAFWAAQGRMDFWAVVAIGTLGSYVGSIANYYLAQMVGVPLLKKYGKYIFINEKKLKLAESWVRDFGVVGIFVARLLPVVRHLISIPAGALKMRVSSFSLATATGAGLWCLILSWYGQKVIGARPELLDSPDALVKVIRDQMLWLIAGVVLIAALYACVIIYQRRQSLEHAPRARKRS